MRSSLIIALCFAVLSLPSFSQEKRKLSHDDYDKWENLTGVEISADGTRALYLLNPQRMDGSLFIRHLQNDEQVVVPRASRAAFSPGGDFTVFHINPPRDVVRQAKVEKKKSDQMPKDSLGIFIFKSQNIDKFADVLSYQLPKESSDWLAFLLEKKKNKDADETARNDAATDSIPLSEEETTEEIKEEKKEETFKQLLIHNPVLSESITYDNVPIYQISENGKTIVFVQEQESEEDSLKMKKVFSFDTSSQRLLLIDSAVGDFKHLVVSKDGVVLSWLFSADTTKVKVYDLFVHAMGRRPETHHISADEENMPQGFAVSEYRAPEFSDDNSRLFFGIAAKPEEEPKDTLLDEEKYSLDVWHWQDPLLQTQQEVSNKRIKEENYLTVFHLETGAMVPLADEEMPDINRDRFGLAPVVMGFSDLEYQRESSWTGRRARDIFLVDVKTGTKKPLISEAKSSVSLSLYGNYITAYDPDQKAWFCYSTKDGSRHNLTAGLKVAFYDEENDVPADAYAYGIAGWAENDKFVLIYDRYDLWKMDPSGKKPAVNITGGYGRENNIRLRHEMLHSDQYHVSSKEIVLSAFNETSKQSGYYTLDMKNLSLTNLVMEDAALSQLQKAKEEDVFIWRRGTFNDYPDLWSSDTDFSDQNKLSQANDWKEEYLWGNVELVEWHDFNNKKLQGLLYLPENFDPQKKYPMIVYFYERTSDNLHRHSIPSPSRSIINPAYCTSNGYIVFMPDITYEIGFPGHSAYNAIVSGTYTMAERYPFINRDRMALQGQSWGGYQIAYLVTKTNMFRAAMAGAPVSNMVSAYGGIRWASGMVRQFQYEKTQSRIGGTLWEKPFHYIENSPVFFAPDIQTPLLIMANDDDGAVPWYQSIELFNALRRLDKPAWMLVYNKEAHNLKEWPARVDLSVRMYQFFDHFLKDEPAPRWLEEGLPFIEKGIDSGYELME